MPPITGVKMRDTEGWLMGNTFVDGMNNELGHLLHSDHCTFAHKGCPIIRRFASEF